MRSRAIQTNRLNAAIMVGWGALFVLGVFFLGLGLPGTWAADHVTRSGRALAAGVVCYLELYLPSSILVLASLAVFVLTLTVAVTNAHGEPPW